MFGSETSQPREHPLARSWARRSRPAFALAGVSVLLAVLAYTQMPPIVPQHAGLIGPPDTWTTRRHMLVFSLIMIVFTTALLLAAGLIASAAPSGVHFRDAERERYWTRADHWPVMRPRLWSLMAWAAGLFALLVTTGVILFTLSPTWGVPTWATPAYSTLAAGAIIWWLLRLFRAMTTLP